MIVQSSQKGLTFRAGFSGWMLGVPADSLEVGEPEGATERSDDALAALLG